MRGAGKQCPAEFTPVVMAAGLGSRMYHLTTKLPKCLVPVANIPMIWYPVSLLARHKFEEVFVVVRESAKTQVEYYLTAEFDKLKFEFITIEDDSDYGTADSLREIKTKSDLLVISCDTITNLPLHKLANIYRANNSVITLLLSPHYVPPVEELKKKKKNKGERDFIGLEPDTNRVLFVSHEADLEDQLCLQRAHLTQFPHIRMYTELMDAHLYLISRSALTLLDSHSNVAIIRGEMVPMLVKRQVKEIIRMKDTSLYAIDNQDDSMANFQQVMYEALTPENPVGCYAYPTEDEEFCIRMNNASNYIMLNKAVSKHMELPPVDLEKCNISPRTQVGADSRLSVHVTIGEKCSVKRSFIGKNSVVGSHCKFTDTVIMENVKIGDNVMLNNCIVCHDVTINNRATLTDCTVGTKFEVDEGAEYIKESLLIENEMDYNTNSSPNSDEF